MSVDPSVTARLVRERVRRDTWITATGPSMEPRIAPGARLRIELESRRPRLGEVWLFVSGSGDLVVHRVLRRSSGGRLVFVGDAAPGADRPVRPDWLVGRVVEICVAGSRRRITRRSGVPSLTRAVARGLWRRLAARLPHRGC